MCLVLLIAFLYLGGRLKHLTSELIKMIFGPLPGLLDWLFASPASNPSFMPSQNGISNFESNALRAKLSTPAGSSSPKLQSPIVLIGGSRGEEGWIDFYHPDEPLLNGRTQQRAIIPRRAHSAALIGHKIAITGGELDDPGGDLEFLDSTEIFDLDSQEWLPGPSTLLPRIAAASTVFDNCMFVFGGNDPEDYSCEFLDEPMENWIPLPCMPDIVSSGAAVTFGESIYIIGGGNRWNGERWNASNSVTIFSPNTNRWLPSEVEMRKRRHGLAAAILDNCVVVSGGYDGAGNVLNSVERWDPREQSWKWPLWPMKHRRAEHALVTWNGKLFAIGGTDGDKLLDTVEQYEPRRNKWVDDWPLLRPRQSLVAAECPILVNYGMLTPSRKKTIVRANTFDNFLGHL